MQTTASKTILKGTLFNAVQPQPKIGNKYIQYYYKLADVSKRFNLVNSSSYLDYIDMASDLIDVVNTLKGGNNNSIVIDNDLKEKSLKLIQRYRHVSQNKELQLILDDIESDLKDVSAKNKGQVLSYIKTQM